MSACICVTYRTFLPISKMPYLFKESILGAFTCSSNKTTGHQMFLVKDDQHIRDLTIDPLLKDAG
jgi:hypothetical protein